MNPIEERFALECRLQAAADGGTCADVPALLAAWQAVRWEQYPPEQGVESDGQPVSPA